MQRDMLRSEGVAIEVNGVQPPVELGFDDVLNILGLSFL